MSSKTIELGQIKKINSSNGTFNTLNFDKTIDKIVIHRTVQKNGQEVKEIVEVEGKEVNGRTYFNANINKAADNVSFKLAQGWIDEDRAEQLMSTYEEYGISNLLSVKVKS